MTGTNHTFNWFWECRMCDGQGVGGPATTRNQAVSKAAHHNRIKHIAGSTLIEYRKMENGRRV